MEDVLCPVVFPVHGIDVPLHRITAGFLDEPDSRVVIVSVFKTKQRRFRIGKAINSLVNDVISPLIGLFANTDLTYLSVMVGDVEIRYGAFLTAVINFIIMAVIIFLMVKGMNALAGLGKKKEPEKPAVKMCPYCRSKVAAEATRCPYCTSMLEVKKEDKKEEKK